MLISYSLREAVAFAKKRIVPMKTVLLYSLREAVVFAKKRIVLMKLSLYRQREQKKKQSSSR
jgi:hypothetical protein